MSRLDKINRVMESEQNVQTLLNVIVAEYGVKDFLECTFFALNEESQEYLLDVALQAIV